MSTGEGYDEGFTKGPTPGAWSRRKSRSLSGYLMPFLIGLAALVPQRAFAQG